MGSDRSRSVLRLALLGVAVALAVAFGAAPRAGAVLTPKQLTCSSEVDGGTYSSVLVKSGAECDLYSVTVTGNVIVKSGGALYIGEGATIQGNLTNAGDATVCSDTIDKNVFISGSGQTNLGIIAECDGPSVGGNVQIHGATGSVYVVYSDITGSILATGNSAGLTIEDDAVGGNVFMANNSGGGFVGEFEGPYDFHFLNNTGEFEVGGFTATHNALCRNNTNSIIGEIGAGNRNTCIIF